MAKGSEYKNTLINFDLKSFLEEYSDKNIFHIKKVYPELYKLLADQLNIYPKAKQKLPIFTQSYCFFTPKSYEQSSSEALAGYKANLFKGNLLLDLTGGLGVDDHAFSKTFKKVISIDNNTELNELARINFTKLGALNIERINGDSSEYIRSDIKSDLVYIDADRRTSSRKAVTLADSSPPVLEMLPRLFEISDNVLLKLSPLIDITYLTKTLSHIREIRVLSLENDVKEILVWLDTSFNDPAAIHAVDISLNKGERKYSAMLNEKLTPDIQFNGKYFYEPSGSLIKSGLVNNYAASQDLSVISKNGNFLISNEPVNNFFGRSFVIKEMLPFSKSGIKKYLKEQNLSKANISKRNFPVSADELKKLFGITDGGDDYLFFTTSDEGKKLLYHCVKP